MKLHNDAVSSEKTRLNAIKDIAAAYYKSKTLPSHTIIVKQNYVNALKIRSKKLNGFFISKKFQEISKMKRSYNLFKIFCNDLERYICPMKK